MRPLSAQVSAELTGRVTDATGAAIAGANVAAKSIDTNATRTAITSDLGVYELVSLPVGQYELHVTKDGFEPIVSRAVHLDVGQEATLDFTLNVGEVRQQVVVTGETPIVNATTADISGLVGAPQVKDLPLNGRSFDLLMTLDPGVANFTSQKTGSIPGISNSTVGNNFAVSGNRPEQNLFLLNGVEFTGAAENNMQPGGTSQELLGVDAVREFNVLRDNYGAEYGKHPGAQVLIVTQSGTNNWHGSAFEFARDSVFDAPGFFDHGVPPPFERNQFGGSVGGPMQKDKTLVFANFEGFQQHLNVSDVTNVPDATERAMVAPGSRVATLLNLWPAPPTPCAPPVCSELGGGIASLTSFPLQTIRDDFGTARLDRTFSSKDSAGAIYTIDDSADSTPGVNPFMLDVESLREQVLSMEETHTFSPSLLNTARFGFSRASYFFDGKPAPGTPAASVDLSFVGNLRVGAVNVGGSTASNPATQISLAGSNNGSNLDVHRNLFTYEDQITWTHGRHQWTFGAWFQRMQSNENLALSQYGQLTFSSLQTFIVGNSTATLLYDPGSTPLNWRALFGSGYAEDVLRLNSRLTLSLGFREESSSGWSEAHGRAANYTFNSSGVFACASVVGASTCLPNVSSSAFAVNRAKFLPQPRIGVAWSPLGTKTAIRAGFGMYNDLQDALGYRMDQNAPFNPTYSVAIANFSTFNFPGACSASAGTCPGLLAPGGVQPDLRTPTVISYSLAIERELTPNTSLSVGYLGNHGYHEIVSLDANEPAPFTCPASCPMTYPASFPAGIAGTSVPAGAHFIPAGTPKPNADLAAAWGWFSAGDSSYNALVVDVTHRTSKGLSFRGVYTWSKTMDDGDTLNVTTAQNAPGLVSDPFNIASDRGLATFDARQIVGANVSYDLPFGHGKPFFGSRSGVTNAVVTGWMVNSIVTVQSGFPLTPELSYNPSNNGDGKNPVRPFANSNFAGKVVLGTPAEWFNPQAFLPPPSNGGFYGNLGRDTITGPGLVTWDFSLLKDTQIRENVSLQFRAEVFNILNRANFGTPNPIAFVLAPSAGQTCLAGVVSGQCPVASSSAGQITTLSTSPRQVQLAIKLLW